MEALENGRRVGNSGKDKLTVEEYLDFIDDRTLPLTVAQLRQIIDMHGFRKTRAKKNILTEMVTTMELMDLHRSMLPDVGVSGDARLTLQEVIGDLRSLNWQDCSVTSLLTYGAGTTASADSGITASSAAGNRTIKRKRKTSRSEGRAAEDAGGNSGNSASGTTIAAGSTTKTAGAAFPCLYLEL